MTYASARSSEGSGDILIAGGVGTPDLISTTDADHTSESFYTEEANSTHAYASAATPSSDRLRPSIKRGAPNTSADRYRLGLNCRQAHENALKLVDAAKRDDWREKASLGLAIIRNLQVLWQLRQLKDESWAAAANTLQLALMEDEIETLEVSACETIAAIIADYFVNGVVDKEELVQIRRKLMNEGMSAWAGIVVDP